MTAAEARKNVFVWAIAVLTVALGLSLVPTPYYIVAPGSAVDLSTRLVVEGRAPPRRRLYLTDVSVARASVLLLPAALFPGVRLVKRDAIVPAGESARGYDRLMVDAMGESQNEAAIVAERAAGYSVPEPPRHLIVHGFLPTSRAVSALVAGDEIERVGGVPVTALGDIGIALRGVRAGTPVTVALVRGGRAATARVVTIAGPHGARLGILVRSDSEKPVLPVPVHYAIGDIGGSSGGLMFALEIYAGLRPSGATESVAGTGTISSDGRVGPIEGAPQKLIAARRAGVTTFLVPRENYAEIAGTAGMRIVPVGTFREALAAIAPRQPRGDGETLR
jgi:PDZ domain-containing protein